MNKITATCAICGYSEDYLLDKEEYQTLMKYKTFGRSMGLIQNIFPKIPAWIRSGAIDLYSDGFCICPHCNPFAERNT